MDLGEEALTDLRCANRFRFVCLFSKPITPRSPAGNRNEQVVLDKFLSVLSERNKFIVVVAITLLSFPVLLAACPDAELKLQRFESAERHMGTSFRMILYAEDPRTANRAFATAFARIQQLNQTLSDYDTNSELGQLGATSPHTVPVRVSHDLWTVMHHAQQLSAETNGAFDATVGPLTKLWRRARRRKMLPPAVLLEQARKLVDYEFLEMDPNNRSIRLVRPNMRLDVGALGKGYAADMALAELRALGIARASVDAGGDLALGDPPPGADGWKIAVANTDLAAAPSRMIRLANVGVATSGDARQFVEIDGVRYSHIVDPRTGLGLTSRSSVTVVARDCMTADALASAISVMGPHDGLKLARAKPCVSGVLVVLLGECGPQTYATGLLCKP